MLEKILFLGHHPLTGGDSVTGQAVSTSGGGGFSPLTIIIVLIVIVLVIAFWIGRKKK